MSGIAGVVNFKRAPVNPAALRRMEAAMAYRAADGSKIWLDGSVGLAHCHFWTTPEDKGEEQPIQSCDDDIWVTADARIDNRDALIPTLLDQGVLKSHLPSDAELILASYMHWGHECAKHLIGDYAFAIWDGRKKRLFLARDVVGIRQLFYARIGDTFYFATTIGAIVAALDERPALNRELLFDYLVHEYRRFFCQTVYRDINCLPPAHWVTVSNNGLVERKLYYALGTQKYDYEREDEWVAAFRDLLMEATRCRLRGLGPVGMAVSGGLDSSALAGFAHRLQEEGRVLNPIRLYSYVYDNTPTADEREFFELVVQHCPQFASTQLNGEDLWAFREIGVDGGYPLDSPEPNPFTAARRAIARVSHMDGCRVMLTGEGANQVLAHWLYADRRTLSGLGLRDSAAEARIYRKWGHTYAGLAYASLLRPRLPARTLRWLQAIRPTRAPIYPWVLCHDTGLSEISACGLSPDFNHAPQISITTEYAVLNPIRGPYDHVNRRAIDIAFSMEQMEMRYPFYDRRVLEILLAIPRVLQSWRGTDRIILRESARGVMPDSVRTRRAKANLGELFRTGFTAEKRRIEALMADSTLESMGFVDGQLLQEAIKQCEDGSISAVGRIVNTVLAEIWLRDAY